MKRTTQMMLAPVLCAMLAATVSAASFFKIGEKAPAFYYFLGVRNEKKGFVHQIHTEWFDADEDVIPLGVRLMTAIVLDYLGRN